ncbi:UNKNOWN [Stylonychia lemnae]|uniref:Uncharacterized protein n=1 Tax=Stylonychia lemnae TaxID=5949 RepID=A0A078AVQ8_STYLE|nr:UNKNOWN [Stylonychia lemnae]|eukprot:CDW86166.1 UNKNOWN [Stylonychia lemnae]
MKKTLSKSNSTRVLGPSAHQLSDFQNQGSVKLLKPQANKKIIQVSSTKPQNDEKIQVGNKQIIVRKKSIIVAAVNNNVVPALNNLHKPAQKTIMLNLDSYTKQQLFNASVQQSLNQGRGDSKHSYKQGPEPSLIQNRKQSKKGNTRNRELVSKFKQSYQADSSQTFNTQRSGMDNEATRADIFSMGDSFRQIVQTPKKISQFTIKIDDLTQQSGKTVPNSSDTNQASTQHTQQSSQKTTIQSNQRIKAPQFSSRSNSVGSKMEIKKSKKNKKDSLVVSDFEEHLKDAQINHNNTRPLMQNDLTDETSSLLFSSYSPSKPFPLNLKVSPQRSKSRSIDNQKRQSLFSSSKQSLRLKPEFKISPMKKSPLEDTFKVVKNYSSLRRKNFQNLSEIEEDTLDDGKIISISNGRPSLMDENGRVVMQQQIGPEIQLLEENMIQINSPEQKEHQKLIQEYKGHKKRRYIRQIKIEIQMLSNSQNQPVISESQEELEQEEGEELHTFQKQESEEQSIEQQTPQFQKYISVVQHINLKQQSENEQTQGEQEIVEDFSMIIKKNDPLRRSSAKSFEMKNDRFDIIRRSFRRDSDEEDYLLALQLECQKSRILRKKLQALVMKSYFKSQIKRNIKFYRKMFPQPTMKRMKRLYRVLKSNLKAYHLGWKQRKIMQNRFVQASMQKVRDSQLLIKNIKSGICQGDAELLQVQMPLQKKLFKDLLNTFMEYPAEFWLPRRNKKIPKKFKCCCIRDRTPTYEKQITNIRQTIQTVEISNPIDSLRLRRNREQIHKHFSQYQEGENQQSMILNRDRKIIRFGSSDRLLNRDREISPIIISNVNIRVLI